MNSGAPALAPSALRVIDAVENDYDEYVRLFLQLGADAPTPDRARWREELRAQTFFLRSSDASSDPAVAYALIRWEMGEMYVGNVVVDVPWRRCGVGRVLMNEIARRARLLGCDRWRLNVKSDNVAAQRLYRAFGFARAYATHTLRLAWDRVPRLDGSFAAGVVAREIVGADEAAHVEHAFDLFPGVLAHAVGSGARIPIGLFAPDGLPLGVARFDPTFPGAMPFRTRETRYARALLEGMLAWRQAAHAWVQLAVEDDDALAAALFAAGGEPRYELVHMRGDVPD